MQTYVEADRVSRAYSAGRRRSSTAASWTDRRLLATVLCGFAVVTIIWDLVNRRGQPFDIDESGYLTIAFQDFHALGSGGLLGWIREVETPSFQSPLTTAVTTPVFLLFGPHPLAALLIPLGFTLITVATTFALARRCAGRSIAWCAAILVATCPIVMNYSRDYHFAAAATAITTLTLYCVNRSAGLRSLRWSLALGCCVGLLPLARTMTIAFVPGIILALAVLVLVSDGRGLRLIHGILSALAALLVSATWLGINGNGLLVWSYLTDYGYGPSSSEYGEHHALFSFQSWLTMVQIAERMIYLPHMLIFFAGAAAGTLLVARLLLKEGRGGLLRIARSPLLPAAFLVLGGAAALTSSANNGSGFCLPLVPAMCMISAWGLFSALDKATTSYPARSLRMTLVGTVALLAVVPSLVIAGPLSEVWKVTVPSFGDVIITSGQSLIEHYAQDGSTDHLSREDMRAAGLSWVAANQAATGRFARADGEPAIVAMGFRHRMYNPNSINLAQVTAGKMVIPMSFVQPATNGDDVHAYTSWLTTGTAATACVLLTADGTENEIVPIVAAQSVTRAAVSTGFTALSEWSLPDGRVVTEWQRAGTCPP